MSFSFTTEFTKDNNICIVYFKDNLMHQEEAIQLKQYVDQKLEEGTRKFVFEFSGFQYMNSTGLSILINLFTKCRNKGGESVIAAINEKLNDLLVITKLHNVFQICESKKQAIKLLSETNL